jgi:hypothetical protein
MTELQTADVPRLEARFAPATWNAEARTVELSWGRGVEVERMDWRTDQRFIERLTMDAASVDLARLNGGAPLLDTHARYSLGSVIGTVERAWIESGEGRAIVRFSQRDEVQPILRDVQDGILRNVSVGYAVDEWKESRDERGRLVRTAVRWTPHEISLVPVPADASAQVRAAGSASALHPGDHHIEEGRMADTTQAPDTSAQSNAPAVKPVDEAAIRAAAAEGERTRIASLEAPAEQARAMGMDATSLAAMRGRAIETGMTAEQFQAELFQAIAKGRAFDAQAREEQKQPGFQPRPVSQFGRSYDDPALIVDAMATALAAREMPGVRAKVGEGKWREYASLRPSDMLMELARARGENVSARDRGRLIDRAFHTTSDFPLLLANAGNKMLEAGYALANPSYRIFFGRKRFNDFKDHSFLTAGDFPALAEMVEGAEITSGTISEKREIVRARTYARQVRVTRQMLINDDLGAFADFGTMIGRRVADYENSLAYSLVNTATGDGPTLAEGSAAVFGTGAGRANKSGSSTTVTAAALSAGFNGMKRQSSLDGLRLNLQPRYLVCSPIQEFVAAQFASSAVVPAQASGVNVFAGRYDVVSDANIPDNRWYLFADPAAAPVYIYGYVGDAEGPSIRSGQPLGVDATVLDVVHDFGVGAIDYRGGWFNPGAAPA